MSDLPPLDPSSDLPPSAPIPGVGPDPLAGSGAPAAPVSVPPRAVVPAGRGARAAARLLAALWLGAGAFLLFVAAPAAFRASDSPTNAANVVGAMLTFWHYIGLGLPLLLLLLEWRRGRARMIAVLFAAILCAAIESGVDLRIRAIRNASVVPISSLPQDDAVRRRFGILHGISSVLLLAQIGAAAAAVAFDDES